MKSFWTLLLSVVFSSVSSMAQGVELYGGYPVSLKARSESQKVSNWNNGVAGINVTAYIRSVAVQVGVGYMSKNYTVYNDWYRGNVFHHYIYVPVMVYPRLYTDGKNTLSIGVGCKVKFPAGKVKASIVYADGHTPGSYKGGYTLTALPRISLRYSRSFGKRFLFFVDVFSEFNVKDNFTDGGSGGHAPPPYIIPSTIPSYYSLVTLGANAGIGYLLPMDGNGIPRYFQKRQKKTP